MTTKIQTPALSTNLIRPSRELSIPYISPDLRRNAVGLKQLKLDPKNPRRGDLETVKQSLKDNGQQSPIILYKYPDDNQYTVIAGNHRCKAALELGWKYVSVNRYKGTPKKARAFGLMDNRSSDLAGYDNDALAQILTELKNEGLNIEQSTAYSEAELSYLISQSQLTGDEDDPAAAYQEIEVTDEAIEDIEPDFHSVVTYNREVIFPSKNKWGIPDLLPDMLADPPNDVIRTWPGQKFADLEWEGYWWLLWGYSTNGCDFSRAYLAFYAGDHKLEPLWQGADKYIKNFVSNRLAGIVTPDFSLWDHEPLALKVYNNYRDRWFGRIMQEAGIKVIPNVCNSQKQEDLEYIYSTIPKSPPTVAFQVQTNLKESSNSYAKNYYTLAIKHMLKIVNPQSIIIYGSRAGHRLTWNMFPKQLHVIRVATVHDTRRHLYTPDEISSVKSTSKPKKIRRRKKNT